MLVIHGLNSDLLSRETVAAMRARREHMDLLEVPEQGHVPLLIGETLLSTVANFVRACEAESQATKRPGTKPPGAAHNTAAR
jgi:hypothetical protein